MSQDMKDAVTQVVTAAILCGINIKTLEHMVTREAELRMPKHKVGHVFAQTLPGWNNHQFRVAVAVTQDGYQVLAPDSDIQETIIFADQNKWSNYGNVEENCQVCNKSKGVVFVTSYSHYMPVWACAEHKIAAADFKPPRGY